MKIIAIDVGTQMGICYTNVAGKPTATSRDFSPREAGKTGADEDEGPLARYSRAKAFTKSVAFVCHTHWANVPGPVVLIYEGASGFTRGIAQTKVANELRGIVFAEIGARFPDIFVYEVAPSTLKKYVTGSGKAEKSDMLIHARRRWGCRSSQNDEVDAFCLWKYAELYGIEGLRVLQAQKGEKKKQGRLLRAAKKRTKAPKESGASCAEGLDSLADAIDNAVDGD